MKGILKDNGQKPNFPLTTQRRLILDLIRQADEHLDADELYRRARKKGSRISLATIYRNLKLFKKIGLITQSNLGTAHSHYEMRGAGEHHHLVCLGCGRVIEFDSPLIVEVKAAVEGKHGFDILSTQFKMEGYCPKCRQREK